MQSAVDVQGALQLHVGLERIVVAHQSVQIRDQEIELPDDGDVATG